MKRRNIFLFSFIALIIEIVYSLNAINLINRFVNSTLEGKYIVLFTVLYISSCLFSLFFWIFIHPDMDDSNSTKQNYYNKTFGQKSFNFWYTYHFLAFAGAMFYTSSWAWFIMAVFLFIVWNYVRCKQNDYADAYELEITKEKAKRKPTVELE